MKAVQFGTAYLFGMETKTFQWVRCEWLPAEVQQICTKDTRTGGLLPKDRKTTFIYGQHHCRLIAKCETGKPAPVCNCSRKLTLNLLTGLSKEAADIDLARLQATFTGVHEVYPNVAEAIDRVTEAYVSTVFVRFELEGVHRCLNGYKERPGYSPPAHAGGGQVGAPKDTSETPRASKAELKKPPPKKPAAPGARAGSSTDPGK